MRKISEDASRALLNRVEWQQDNTRVTVRDGIATMYLHGNAIAKYDWHTLQVSWAGWATKTTCSRLTALPGVQAKIVAGEVLINGYTVAPSEWLTV